MGCAQPGGARAPGAPLTGYFERLLNRFGPQGWWPARTRMEVVLGAILTQNTSWNNAALALAELRARRLLRIDTLRRVSQDELETAIRPSGFFRQKAAAIKGFIRWLDENYAGSLAKLFSASTGRVRGQMLELRGLGPETVDAILLYAGSKPWFVADVYTRRVLSRHGWLDADAGYAEAQALLHRELPRDHRLFNEFHALLVEVGKRFCTRSAPDCARCPLRDYLPTDVVAAGLPRQHPWRRKAASTGRARRTLTGHGPFCYYLVNARIGPQSLPRAPSKAISDQSTESLLEPDTHCRRVGPARAAGWH
ncbi:MAG: endonuclease III domain-containing protein [Terriglobia bacterium]